MEQKNLLQEASAILSKYMNQTKDLWQALDEGASLTKPSLDMKSLVDLDQELDCIMQVINSHQVVQARINERKKQLAQLLNNSRSTIEILNDSIQDLESILNSAKQITNKQNTATGVDCTQLLNYAQRVAKHTLSSIEPPIPQDNQMRVSMLYQREGKEAIVKSAGLV